MPQIHGLVQTAILSVMIIGIGIALTSPVYAQEDMANQTKA